MQELSGKIAARPMQHLAVDSVLALNGPYKALLGWPGSIRWPGLPRPYTPQSAKRGYAPGGLLELKTLSGYVVEDSKLHRGPTDHPRPKKFPRLTQGPCHAH